MKPAFFSPRIVFIATLTAIMALAVAGWVLWSLAGSQYRHLVDGWIEEGRAAGYQISYDDRQMFGFPRRMTMRLTNLQWKTADGIDFGTDDMDLVATPWDWNNFDVKFKNHVAVAAPTDKDGRALIMSSNSGRMHLRLDNDGIWRAAKFSLENAMLGLAPNYIFKTQKLSASVTRPDVDPKDHTQVGLVLEGEANGVTIPEAMPSPFGNKAEKFVLHMRVMGHVPDVRKRAEVNTWNNESGIVEFDAFSLKWGTLDVDAKGTMGFDDDLQPEGAFSGTVANAEKTMHVLIDQGFVAMHDKNMLAAAMDMFAQPLPSGSRGLEMPITVQLGGLFIGPIRIFTFPQIQWPDEPPLVH